MDKILIRGLEISARHGVHDYEKTNAQRFVFDADAEINFMDAAYSDDLGATVSYSAICDKIAEVTRANTFNLIEKLVYECAYAVMDAFPAIAALTLTAYKPDAPVKHVFETVGVSAEVRRERAYLSLGSSVGDRKNYLDRAADMLGSTRGITVLKVSDYITTKPYGGVAKNEFLNCAAEIETYLSPRALLARIHAIENVCGRVRKARWDDRTLDIDIIFYGDVCVTEPDLVIPHPEWKKRDFVTEPLKQLVSEQFLRSKGLE